MTSGSIRLRERVVKLTKAVAEHDIAWTFIDPFFRIFRHLRAQRDVVVRERLLRQWRCEAILEGRRVLHGPFRGMNFPRTDIQNLTAIYTKILGCYERELHTTIDAIRHRNYKQVLDIGCAEGYYVAGFAQLFPESVVYGFDIDPDALELCRRMVEANGLDQRVRLSAGCTEGDLASFGFEEPSLILCDCEGYEAHLFTEESVKNLKSTDLIVEAHDFVDIHISDNITKLFEPTHRVTRISTLDDLQKARQYHYPETDRFPLEVRKCLFSEGRGRYMEWLFIESQSP